MRCTFNDIPSAHTCVRALNNPATADLEAYGAKKVSAKNSEGRVAHVHWRPPWRETPLRCGEFRTVRFKGGSISSVSAFALGP